MHVECGDCGAGISIESERRTAICPYCASPSVVERPPAPGRPTPSYALGFSVPREAAIEAVRTWASEQSRRFRSSGLRQIAIDDIQGIYAPAYLYSCVADTAFSASIGEKYTTTETYVTRDSQGRTVTRTRTVVKTEWRPLSGSHSTYLADVLVTASRGISNAEMEALEPFNLGLLRRYGPEIVSGWIAEDPTMSVDECVALARGEAVTAVGRRLPGFMPGDTHDGLRFQTSVRDEVLELVLVPIWVLAARYHPTKPPVRVLVNGQTGKVWGKAPVSWPKVLLAVLVPLALIAVAGLLWRFLPELAP